MISDCMTGRRTLLLITLLLAALYLVRLHAVADLRGHSQHSEPAISIPGGAAMSRTVLTFR
jgi:hypothetical protein